MGFISTFSATPNFAVVTGALTATIPANCHEWSINVVSGVGVINGTPLEAGNSLYSQYTLATPVIVSGATAASKVFVKWGV